MNSGSFMKKNHWPDSIFCSYRHVVDDGDPQSTHRIDHIGTSVVCRVLSFQQL